MSRPKGPWRSAFLACLKNSGELDRCAQLSGVTDRAVRKARRQDPTFEADVRDALDCHQRSNVDAALRRQQRYSIAG